MRVMGSHKLLWMAQCAVKPPSGVDAARVHASGATPTTNANNTSASTPTDRAPSGVPPWVALRMARMEAQQRQLDALTASPRADPGVGGMGDGVRVNELEQRIARARQQAAGTRTRDHRLEPQGCACGRDGGPAGVDACKIAGPGPGEAPSGTHSSRRLPLPKSDLRSIVFTGTT